MDQSLLIAVIALCIVLVLAVAYYVYSKRKTKAGDTKAHAKNIKKTLKASK
jgi:hypothetical protein